MTDSAEQEFPAMIRIGIILGSTRPNRNGPQIAQWVLDMASRRADAEFELIDLRDNPLPHLDEPVSPMLGPSVHEHTRAWAERIDPFDGFVIVSDRAAGAMRRGASHV
ncbi:NAD(P)H-dependent oxidoreductase [Nocardia sp. NPDC049707]|uniref:NADPH-dependent FMN reductase n=1 Tax=Nocardia sp. NPDC049707 TaxID=3154735 RepID=UPI00342549CE